MQITVSGGIIRVDGIQYGTKYSSHSLAVNIASQIKDKHYPHATLVDYPEPIKLPIAHHSRKKSVTIPKTSPIASPSAAPSLQLAYA